VSDYKVGQLLEVIKRQNTGLEQLIAERDRLRAELEAFVAWVNGEQDALACLQRVYNNPTADEASVIKAASAALPYERSKPASVVIQVDWKERTRNARLKQLEKDKARWAAEDAAKTIEHQPKLDLEPEGPEPAA
jgi:hypothetical protein